MPRTRKEHMEWCKERALLALDEEGVAQAYASMTSDFTKHDETLELIMTPPMVIGQTIALDEDKTAMRKWIEDWG